MFLQEEFELIEVVCGSDIFYNIRRSVLREMMTEEHKQLFNHLAGEEGKHVFADIGEDGNLSHITIIDQEIALSGYAQNIHVFAVGTICVAAILRLLFHAVMQ